MKTLAIPLALILAIGVLVPIQSFAQDEDFQVEVNADQSTISRGSEQTLNIEASEESDIVGSITYASDFTRAFSGSTNEDGTFQYEWRIGGNSNPGTFKVLVIALGESDAAVATTTFEVTTATPEEEPEEPIPAVDNGTIVEGNGTIIVPEEPVPLPVENGTVINPPVNETGPGGEEPAIPVEVNQTIPIPVPINNTQTNETIPVPIPINTTTGNETIEVPELPTDGQVTPVEPGTEINQTETLPEELPASNETTTTTVPIPIPINQTTGNETIPVPEIPIESNETSPVVTPTPTNDTGTGPITPETPPEDVISVLEERTEALENQTATQEEVFVAVGEAVQDIADAVSTLPIFPDQREDIIASIQNLNDAIADLN